MSKQYHPEMDREIDRLFAKYSREELAELAEWHQARAEGIRRRIKDAQDRPRSVEPWEMPFGRN